MLKGYLQIILAALFWGMGGVIGKWIDLPSTIISFFRFLFAFLALFSFSIATKNKFDFRFPQKKPLLVASIFTVLTTVFFFLGIQFTSVANVTILQYTAPVFVIIFAPFIIKEKRDKEILLHLLLSFAGILFIFTPEKISLTNENLFGILAGLGSGITYAFFIILQKKLRPYFSSLNLTMLQTGISAVILSIFLLLVDFNLNLNKLILLILLGVLTSAIPFALFLNGIKYITSQHASMILYLDPVSSVLYSWLFLGEIPSIYTIIGGFLILYAGMKLVVTHRHG